MTNWEALVTGPELMTAQKERKCSYVDTKERRESMDVLEAEGLELVFEYKDKRFVKMRLSKRFDVRFENKVWLLIGSMGFTSMNKDATFKVSYSKENPSLTQQIDVFAADEETVLVIECKSAEKPGTRKDFKKEIEAFNGMQGGLLSSIKERFGRSINIKFIWATSNIVLGEQDKKRLEDAKIEYFDEKAIDYYANLSQHLGLAAKYQLLGKIFANKDIKNMPDTVPAIRGTMGGHTYYSFLIEPERLLKIGYVLHRDDGNKNMMPTYQRIIKHNRLVSIRDFVNKGGYFPNSIIVSIDAPSPRGLQFDSKSGDENSLAKLGILHLPKKYCSAYIIDGQHRLYAYSESKYASSNSIPVVAFENLDKTEQVRLFMDINENQRAVPKNLRNTLSSDLLWKDADCAKRRYALRLRIAEKLGDDPESPLHDRVQIGENKKTSIRCITMDTFDRGLRAGHFFTNFKNNEAINALGTFDNSLADNDYAFGLIVPYLKLAFNYFKDALSKEWELGEQSGGILTNNTGIYSLLRIFSDTIDFFFSKELLSPKSDTAEKLVCTCEPFFKAIVNFYTNLDPELKIEIKKQYGGKGPIQHWRYLQKAIHDRYEEFSPEGFDDWWADNSKQYNDASIEKLNLIVDQTKKAVRDFLEKEKGAEWRTCGLPVKLAADLAATAVKRNSERRKLKEGLLDDWDYATLEDCAAIARHSTYWSDGLRDILARPSERGKKGDKATRTKWMKDMQKISTELNHPGYSVSRSNYEYIQATLDWLNGESN